VRPPVTWSMNSENPGAARTLPTTATAFRVVGSLYLGGILRYPGLRF
jgi:hypothetical protein